MALSIYDFILKYRPRNKLESYLYTLLDKDINYFKKFTQKDAINLKGFGNISKYNLEILLKKEGITWPFNEKHIKKLGY